MDFRAIRDVDRFKSFLRAPIPQAAEACTHSSYLYIFTGLRLTSRVFKYHSADEHLHAIVNRR
jgi:hypothetical protein